MFATCRYWTNLKAGLLMLFLFVMIQIELPLNVHRKARLALVMVFVVCVRVKERAPSFHSLIFSTTFSCHVYFQTHKIRKLRADVYLDLPSVDV